MTTTTPTADNSSATTDVSTAGTLADLVDEVVPNGRDGDILCFESYCAVVGEGVDVLEDACAGEI